MRYTIKDEKQRMEANLMQTFTQNLIFSLNATIPVFLMMVFG